jgi:uncharacterized protein YuzB (UPF0349 family)
MSKSHKDEEEKNDKHGDTKKVCICKKCSGVDVDEVKDLVNKSDLSVRCLKKCGKHKGKAFGILNGEMIICDTKEEFYSKIKEIL